MIPAPVVSIHPSTTSQLGLKERPELALHQDGLIRKFNDRAIQEQIDRATANIREKDAHGAIVMYANGDQIMGALVGRGEKFGGEWSVALAASHDFGTKDETFEAMAQFVW